MLKSIFRFTILSLSLIYIAHVSAAEPNVPTEPPYIVLNANLDEPNGYGFCIDTFGSGQSELMHTHTCKPKKDDDAPRDDPGHDVRVEYVPATNRIHSYAFEGQCMQVLIAKGKSEFALLECSDHPHQKFVYKPADKTIRLHKDESFCVAVDSETQEAGPWVKRPLTLVECSETEAALKQWLVSPA